MLGFASNENRPKYEAVTYADYIEGSRAFRLTLNFPTVLQWMTSFAEVDPWDKQQLQIQAHLDHMIDRVLFVVDFRSSDEVLMREVRRLSNKRRIVCSG